MTLPFVLFFYSFLRFRFHFVLFKLPIPLTSCLIFLKNEWHFKFLKRLSDFLDFFSELLLFTLQRYSKNILEYNQKLLIIANIESDREKLVIWQCWKIGLVIWTYHIPIIILISIHWFFTFTNLLMILLFCCNH